MRSLLHHTILFILLCLALPAHSDLPDTIEKIKPGIVGIGLVKPAHGAKVDQSGMEFLGTGFVVGKGNQIITNHHVTLRKDEREKGYSLVVFIGHGHKALGVSARVIRTDPDHDLALLEINGHTLPSLTLSKGREVREGDDIAFTGFPVGAVLGLYPATHKGIISAITPIAIPASSSKAMTPAQIKRLRNPYNIYQLNATAFPGSSGSPVFRPDTGEVIAVINGVFVKESKESTLTNPTNISYAIPVRYVHELLQAK